MLLHPYSGSPNIGSGTDLPSIKCYCPEMKKKRELVKKLKKSLKQKLHAIYELNVDLEQKDMAKRKVQDLNTESLEDLEDEEIPLPYHVLRNQYQQEHYKTLLTKKDILKRILKRKLPRGLAYCDEDTLREEIGKHRLLPEGLYRNFVLERAFKGRESIEADLYGGFIETVKNKGHCRRVITKKLLRVIRRNETSDINVDSSLSENVRESAESDILYAFPNHIPDIKTASCECQIVSIKILRLDYIKDLLHQVLESRNPHEQMLTMEIAHSLLKMITEDQVEENVRKRSTHLEESEYSEVSEAGSHSFYKEKRLHGSPSFERFRKRILHEMHINRRPISWFKKRCNYFHKMNQKKCSGKGRIKDSELGEEQRRAQNIKIATDVAIHELLDLHKSKPFLTLQFPDDYTLKKLTMILEKLAEAEKKEEDTTEIKLTQDEDSDWPFNKPLMKNEELMNRVENTMEKPIHNNKNTHLKTNKIDKCSCNRLQAKTLEHAQLIKEIQVLFLDAIFLMETLDKAETESIDEIEEKQDVIEREKYFRGIDLDNLKVNFWEHLEAGKAYESFENHFETPWKNSILNGLFIFNTEIQIMNKEKIIIRPHNDKRVKILSGGRVGLEPLFSEYVAKGFLDCVVLGDKYSGPSVRHIIQSMLEIATEEGILIIIMNELEYRLNFMIAMQHAQEIGIKTDLVLARDDTSHVAGIQHECGQNGSTGIVLQFKVAGAMAEEGYTLSSISRVCQFMFIASVSCTFDKEFCSIGTHFKQIIREAKEQGNERTNQTIKMSSLGIVRRMLNILTDDNSSHNISLEPGSEVILLLNNQGFSYDQMFYVAQSISGQLNEIDVKLERVYIGNFMALSQNGFTITIAKDLDKTITTFLDKSSTCNYWPPHISGSTICKQAVLTEIKDTKLGSCIHQDYIPVVHELFNECLKQIKIFKHGIQDLHPKISSQIETIISQVRPKYVFNKILLERPHQILLSIADDFEILDRYGILFSIFFIAAAQEFSINSNIFVKWRMCCNAFYRGACSLAGYLRYEEGDGTILDFLLPLAKACFNTKQGSNPLKSLKHEFDKLIEASWLNKKDPGIMLCEVLMRSIYDVLERNFGHLDCDSWDVKEDKIYIVKSTNREKIRYGFSTEQIPPDVKEAIQSLTYNEGGRPNNEVVES